MKKEIPKKENFSEWYTTLVLKSGLADYAPVKGCMVIKPYGFSIWEKIQKIFDEKIKKIGVENAYFPLLIPEKFLKKEKEHLQGFSPELILATIGGGKELKEKLVLRPTSETIIYQMYSKWIKSWRDLPLRINQWCNVLRWELRPRLFLRTLEFLWQEGHCAYASHEEEREETLKILKTYVDFYREVLAIDGFWGKKSESEKFPGALETYTFEMLMPDGKALQGCTSHDLGQNFSQPFQIKFLDKKGKEKFVWQNSWGLTTRSIGALVMVHGDDDGLVLPPKIAPIQIVIVPVFTKNVENKILEEKAKEIKEILKKFSVKIDNRKEYSVGWKFNEWELKGVPLRIEIGEKEIKEKKVTLARRDNKEKISLPFSSLAQETEKILDSIQKNLFAKSSKFVKDNTREVSDFAEFKDIMKKKKGFIRAFWCERKSCEEEIKKETKATTRCLPLETVEEKGKCVFCKKPAKRKWLFAQAY
jgi:prolyl-tRNA synthetase